MNDTATENNDSFGLVDGPRLLKALFPDEACRPSLRWLRDQQERKAFPFVKLGRLVFFDPDQVRRAIAEKMTVQPRHNKARLANMRKTE